MNPAGLLPYVMPIGIGLLVVLLLSLVPDPHRRPLNALGIAGAGGATSPGGGVGMGADRRDGCEYLPLRDRMVPLLPDMGNPARS
ncbi:hypothetical protein STENM327S_00979 [Streptomyces tendae]